MCRRTDHGSGGLDVLQDGGVVLLLDLGRARDGISERPRFSGGKGLRTDLGRDEEVGSDGEDLYRRAQEAASGSEVGQRSLLSTKRSGTEVATDGRRRRRCEGRRGPVGSEERKKQRKSERERAQPRWFVPLPARRPQGGTPTSGSSVGILRATCMAPREKRSDVICEFLR